MKKRVLTSTAAMVALLSLSACGKGEGGGEASVKSDRAASAGVEAALANGKEFKIANDSRHVVAVNAATVIMPALASIHGDPVIEDNEYISLAACRLAGGDAAVRAQLDKEIEDNTAVALFLEPSEVGDISKYKPGYVAVWPTKDKPGEYSTYQIDSVDVSTGTIVILDEAGQKQPWQLAKGLPAKVGYKGHTKEHDALMSSRRAAWDALTPAAAVAPCLGTIMRKYVDGMQVWNAANNDEMRVEARTWTIYQVEAWRLARDVAALMGPTVYQNQADATAMAQRIATSNLGQEWVHHLVVDELPSIDKISINLQLSGGTRWIAHYHDIAYAFNCDTIGCNIAVTGGQWAGDGWMAGAKTDIEVSAGSSVTLTKSSTTTTTGASSAALMSAGHQ